MYEIYIETHFSAAHHLRNYQGKCEAPHGHNWIVEVYVQCESLNEIGIGIDFKDVKNAVKEVLEDLDHKDLNELPIFSKENPTSENIAKYLYKELSQTLNNENIKVSKIKVCETPGSGSLYWE
jgi:6-pyruvoyltetrahydropterin/6-carboxytetrahydropterin synthase